MSATTTDPILFDFSSLTEEITDPVKPPTVFHADPTFLPANVETGEKAEMEHPLFCSDKNALPGAVEGRVLTSQVSASSSGTHSSTSQNSQDVYTQLRESPWEAVRVDFRQFHFRKVHVPHDVQLEPSVGVFIGQLPNSYSEDDVKALLYAIAHQAGRTVQVRSVKSHGMDGTCAFVMVNHSALPTLLTFNRRILCDINCFWVVEPSRTALLPRVIEQTPRHCLRGVPKAPLVLEKLVPQTRNRGPANSISANQNSNNKGNATSNNAGRNNAHRAPHNSNRQRSNAATSQTTAPQPSAMPVGGVMAAHWNGTVPLVGSAPWVAAGNPAVFCPAPGYAPPAGFAAPYVFAAPGMPYFSWGGAGSVQQMVPFSGVTPAMFSPGSHVPVGYMAPPPPPPPRDGAAA